MSSARVTEQDLQTRYVAFKRFLARFPPSTECQGPGEAVVIWLLHRVATETVQALKQQGVEFPSGGACVPSQVFQLRDVGCMSLYHPMATEECKQEIDEVGAIRALQHCASRSRLTVIDVTLPKHANVALLDNKLGTLELFDPSGPSESPEAERSFDAQMQVLRRLAELALQRPVQYVPPLTLCPLKIGPQTWAGNVSTYLDCPDGGGYCVVFALLYADLRMQFPDVLPARLVGLLLQESPESLFTMARQYLSWIRTVIPVATAPGAEAQLTRLQAQVVQPFMQSHPALVDKITTLTAEVQTYAKDLLIALHVLRLRKQPIGYSMQLLFELGNISIAATRLDAALLTLRNFPHSLAPVFPRTGLLLGAAFPSVAILEAIAPTIDFLVRMPTADAHHRQPILEWVNRILTAVSHDGQAESAVQLLRARLSPPASVGFSSLLAAFESLGAF